MSRKTLEQASIKATVAQQTQQRTIEFYMLAFSDTPDKQGDRIARDAADLWLRHFYSAGVPLPISFTHSAVTDPGDPFNIIGYAPADKAHVFKDEHGIRVIGVLDVEHNPTAAQVWSLAKRQIVTGASVFFMSLLENNKIQKDGSTLITKIEEIIECGPCLEPANEDAYIVAVKAMQESEQVIAPPDPADVFALALKAGRKLSRLNEAKLREVRDTIDELLSLVSEPVEDQKANDEEPEEAKSDEPDPLDWLRDELAANEEFLTG